MHLEYCSMTPLHWPIWTAALIAAECRAKKNGESDPVYWQIGGDYVLYTATEKVVVEPFGIRLLPGDALEVRWETGSSGYRAIVRRAQKRPGRRGRQ